MKRWVLWLSGGAAGGLAVLLLCRETVAAQGVRDGIELCVSSVIPALFPFFVASQLLVALGAAEAAGRVLGPLFGHLFGVDGAGASALLLGLTGGYPVGAKTVESLVRQGLLDREDGAVLLAFCNNAGPAFILGIAGSGVFRSGRAGAWLYGIHAVSAVLIGVFFHFIMKQVFLPVSSDHFRFSASSCISPAVRGRKAPLSPAAALVQAVGSGVRAMAGVCGSVVFFLVLLRLAEDLLGPLPPPAAGFVELTNGILRLTSDRTGFLTAAGLLGWGGLSVHCQTAAVLAGSGVSMRYYLPAKAAQGLLSAALAAAVWKWAL